MSDCTFKSSSSLVVADKNTRKSGGCVGIFFKLFDWNRRFAKKKLFPKKLLAPSRGNQVSKKFSATENLTKTKHLLSGDGNEGKKEMGAPSLVAKLMGLESMPVVKPQSADKSQSCGNANSELEKEVLILAKGGSRNRFGADAIQIRNALSRSRRRHPKLALPVKSPRVVKSSSRLIDAATRILEPGRAKCALTYSNPKTVIRLPVQSVRSVEKPHDLNSLTSCRNCGHALEEVNELNPTIDMTFFDKVQESKRSQNSRCDSESEVVLLRSRHQPESREHKTAYNDKKDFIAKNRNVSESQFRLPRKPENNFTEIRRQYRVPQDGAFSTRGNIMAGIRPRFSGNLAYPTCVKSQTFVQGSNVDNGSESRSLFPTQMNHSAFVNGDVSQKRLVKEGNEDALGSLLVQKLKELTSQGENESTSVTPRGRTAAAILQELISALTAERPISSDLNPATTYNVTSQGDARSTRLPMRFSGNHFSPGSVLDASFSNDSCVSSSVDDSSGNMHHCDLMDLSFDDPQLLHSDTDHYDSSSSFNNAETSGNVPVMYLLDHICRVLDRTNLPDMKLPTAYSGYTKEVLFNLELLFGNADHHSERFVDFLVGPFLFELETLAIAAWRNTIASGFRVSKGGNRNGNGNGNPLRRFLFDCLVECLNTRYERYINCGFTAWCRLPRQLNMEALIQVFDYEVTSWASLSEMSLDDVIDLEMSTSLGKWTDLEAEMFEAGAEIGLIILQGLVDEVIADFLYKLYL